MRSPGYAGKNSAAGLGFATCYPQLCRVVVFGLLLVALASWQAVQTFVEPPTQSNWMSLLASINFFAPEAAALKSARCPVCLLLHAAYINGGLLAQRRVALRPSAVILPRLQVVKAHTLAFPASNLDFGPKSLHILRPRRWKP